MGEHHDRAFKGIWIPAEIWLDENLTALEKIVWAEIDSLDGDDGCYASNEYLSEFCQCSPTKVSKAISKLKSLGYVEQVSFDGRTRVLSTSCKNKNSALQKGHNQTCQKDKSGLLKEQAIYIEDNIGNSIDTKSQSKDCDLCVASTHENDKSERGEETFEGVWGIDELTSLAKDIGCLKLIAYGKIERFMQYHPDLNGVSRSAVSKMLLEWESRETGGGLPPQPDSDEVYLFMVDMHGECRRAIVAGDYDRAVKLAMREFPSAPEPFVRDVLADVLKAMADAARNHL